MTLKQLIYVSSICHLELESEIGNILNSSIRRNEENNITGMLLYSGGNFLQVLEGEEDKVIRTFARIKQDSRHCQITEILFETITQRDFPKWSMGFRHLSAEDIKAIPESDHFFQIAKIDKVLQIKPGIALGLLLQFSQNSR